MTSQSHVSLVDRQFGARADAYLASQVHAAGADLDQLAQVVRGRGDARVLDLGCGAGHVSLAVAPQVREVVAFDLSSEMLATVGKAARERGLPNVSVRQGVVEELPFADADFDVVLTRYSAHHWADLAAGLRQARRVLRPDGVFAVVDAVSPGAPALDTFLQTIEMLRDPSHVRDYARAQWKPPSRRPISVVESRTFSVRLHFSTWTARMQTPAGQVAAIRALQQAVSDPIRRHFAVGEDGSFDLEVAFLRAQPVGT